MTNSIEQCKKDEHPFSLQILPVPVPKKSSRSNYHPIHIVSILHFLPPRSPSSSSRGYKVQSQVARRMGSAKHDRCQRAQRAGDPLAANRLQEVSGSGDETSKGSTGEGHGLSSTGGGDGGWDGGWGGLDGGGADWGLGGNWGGWDSWGGGVGIDGGCGWGGWGDNYG